MILCDKDIKNRIKNNNIIIKPFSEEQLSSSSVDLRLGNEFRVFKPISQTHIDPKEKQPNNEYTDKLVINNGEAFIIHPGEFVLATTKEWVEMPIDLVGSVDGRSSIGRLGIIIQTAPMIDAGFKGNITLELANIGRMPVSLYPDMRICRLTFHQLTQACENPYNGKYLNQKSVEDSKLNNEF